MANVMELMGEYKRLKQLKESGQLSGADEARLKEVAVALQAAMGKGKGDAAAAPAAKAAPAAPAVPKPAPAPPKPAPAAAKPADEKPLWQRQAEEDAERQRRAQSMFSVEMPDEVEGYEPPVTDTPRQEFYADDSSIDESGPSAGMSLDGDPRFQKPPKPPPKPRSEEDLVRQLEETYAASQYELSYDDALQTDYYYSHVEEGYEVITPEFEVTVNPIDPREIELHRAGLLSSSGAPGEGAVSITCVPGGVFLDDFMELYEKGVLPRPEDEEEPEIDDPSALIPGKRKVTLHMLNGEVKRGSVRRIQRGDPGFTLLQERGRKEEIAFGNIKALFIMKGKHDPPDLAGARRLTVEFKDHRRVQGLSPDYEPGMALFTLVPSGPGNFERVIVNAAAVARLG